MAAPARMSAIVTGRKKVARWANGSPIVNEVSPPNMSCGTVLAPIRILPFPVGLPRDVAHIRDSPIALVPPGTLEGIRIGHSEKGGSTDDVVLGPAGHFGLERSQPRILRRFPGFRTAEVGEPEAGI